MPARPDCNPSPSIRGCGTYHTVLASDEFFTLDMSSCDLLYRQWRLRGPLPDDRTEQLQPDGRIRGVNQPQISPVGPTLLTTKPYLILT